MNKIQIFLNKHDISIKDIIYKIIFPSISKIIIVAGLGLIGIPLLDIIVISTLQYFGFPIEQSNNPLWGFLLVIIGLGYELFKYWIDKKNYPSNSIISQLKHIRNDFFNGEIQNAIEHLEEAKQEHNLNQNALYEILILEAEIAFYLRRLDETENDLKYINDNFSKKLNERYYQLLLSIYALHSNKDDFDKVALKLQKEFSSNQPKEYFEILYCLNSGQTNEAKEIYDLYKQENQDNKFSYLGGLIYHNLHNETNDLDDYKKSETLFKYHLENNNPNFFEKLEIYKFLSIHAFNQLLLNQLDEDYKVKIEQTKDLLLSIINSFDYFEKNIRKFLQNHYLHCLYITDKQEFVNYYEQLNENDIDMINFVFYRLDLPKEINTEIVEKRILENSETELLISYLNKMVSIEPETVLSFIETNKSYMENEIVSNIVLEAKILTEKTIDEEEFYFLVARKDDSLISYISYLEAKSIKSDDITKEELDYLVEKLYSDPIQEILVVKTMKLLSQNGRQKQYLEVGLKYKDSFYNVIRETLKICENDRNLWITDFDNFVENISDDIYSIQIANIYRSYSKLTKAYEYYKKAWEHLDFLDNNKIEFASYVLQNCSLPYFFQNSKSINRDQDSIYKSYLEERQDSLSLLQTYVLAYFTIVVEESYGNGFYIINKKLLGVDVNALEKQDKEMLTSLYLYAITHKLDIKSDMNTNLLIKKNETYYIDSSVYPSIDSSYSFEQVDHKSFDLIQYEVEIESFSLYHYICNKFFHNLDTNKYKTFLSSEEDPLQGIREFLHERAKQGQEQLESYSNGDNISFYTLANGEYRHYFGLINILLNSENLSFYAGKNNPQPYEVNKILTLSSIVFLNKIDKLDLVLKREDIYIQQTTVNWLLDLIKELNSSKEMLTVFSDGSNIYKNLVDKKGIEEDKSFLLELAHKIVGLKNIIDDTDSIFQIRESYEMFAPHIGEQEYRALAYAVEHHFQIISEDRTFLFFYETMKFNTYMVSNSLSVVNNLLEPNDLLALVKDLDKMQYSYILNQEAMTQVLKKIIFQDPIYMLKWYKKDFSDSFFEVMLHIIKKYGWLDWLEKYYIENYTMQIPSKTTKKPRTYITSNIEYIFDLTGIKIG